MTRDEFLALLRQELRDMPPGDAEDALRYYSEYFDDAGAENEQQTLRDLGSPAVVAAQIKANNAYRNSQQQPPAPVRRGCSSVMTGVLAVCAAPIAVPLLIAGLAVFFALAVAALCVLAAFLLVVAVLIGVGVFMLACPFLAVMSGVTVVYHLGSGMVLIGLGIFATVGMYYAVRWTINMAANLLYKIAKRKEPTPHV